MLLSLSAAVAQEYHYRGNVLDDATGEPLIGANVYAEPKGAGAVTDAEGHWELTSKQRVKRLVVSYVGYKSKRITSPRQDGKPISVRLEVDETTLSSVVVVAKRQERALRESAMPISVISMRQLQGTASSIDEVLSRTTGVTLRNTGGLGSASRISLRGLEGKRMGIYIDETPFGEMSDFISINDIPTDMIERVEVYKGIVPYKFGGSAMGGAVNVVIKEYPPKYFDASYEVGSYNSHMLSTVFKRTLEDAGVQLGVGGTLAYSDNNYKMELPQYKDRIVRRDHDQFRKAILGGSLKATKWWFDEIKLECAGTYIRREIQGFEWDVREAFTLSKGLALESTFKRADFFLPGLDLDASVGVVFGQNGLTDKAAHRYDWDGKEYPAGSSYGGELSSIPADGVNRTINLVDKLNLNYTLDRHQAFNLNLCHTYAYRNPTDTLMDRALGYKANFKSRMNSLTAGASYDLTLFEDKLQNAFTDKIWIPLLRHQPDIHQHRQIPGNFLYRHAFVLCQADRYRDLQPVLFSPQQINILYYNAFSRQGAHNLLFLPTAQPDQLNGRIRYRLQHSRHLTHMRRILFPALHRLSAPKQLFPIVRRFFLLQLPVHLTHNRSKILKRIRTVQHTSSVIIQQPCRLLHFVIPILRFHGMSFPATFFLQYNC